MTDDKAQYPSDAADKFLLRLPEGMRDQLKAAARAANRTMNAEIVARLQASFESAIPPAATNALLEYRTFQDRLDSALANHAVMGMQVERLSERFHALANAKPRDEPAVKAAYMALVVAQQDWQRMLQRVDQLTDESSAVERRFHQAMAEAGGPVEEEVKRAREKVVDVGAAIDPSTLAHYQAIRRGHPEIFDPGPPPVEKHAPQPSPNARKSPPKKR